MIARAADCRVSFVLLGFVQLALGSNATLFSKFAPALGLVG